MVGGAGYYFVADNESEQSKWRTTEAKKQDVVQDVIFTGRITSKQVSNLSFESTGAVSELYVSVGDKVSKGQSLAKLETRLAELNSAKSFANRVSTQDLKKKAWEKAKKAWEDTKAVNDKTIELKEQTVRDKKDELDEYKELHQKVAVEQGEDDSTTQTYVTKIELAQTAYHNARKALEQTLKSAEKSETAAEEAAELAEKEYAATLQASSGVAGLSSLEAIEAMDRYSLTKKTLVAPFKGVVTKVNKESGETATVGETVVTVETVDSLELTADVTETDASKITERMGATVGFDALPPQEKWPATVVDVAPAAKIIESVPTYKITLAIDSKDDRFKPGLTANVTVHADERKDVIAVPRRAVINEEGKQYIRILKKDGEVKRNEINTGLVGSMGTIEITEGLREGEKVIIDSRESKQ